MSQIMERFLNSIGLKDEQEKFDVEFAFLRHNQNDPKQVDMRIRKATPWDYPLLREFKEALLNIHYRYTLEFEYQEAPDREDVEDLLQNWYLDVYRQTPGFRLEENGEGQKGLKAVFPSEESREKETAILKDFNEFLAWLGYPFVLLGEVEAKQSESPKEETASLMEEEPSKEDFPTSEEALDSASESEDAADLESMTQEEVRERIESDFAKSQEEGENALMERLIANQKAMEEERNRQRVFRVGDYKMLDRIQEVESAGLANVDFSGEAFEIDMRTTKKGKKMLLFGIGDASDAISCRAFESKRTPIETLSSVKEGANYRIRGAIDTDFRGQKEIIVHFIDPLPKKPLRDDPEEEKRVELHLHTKMSTMDGVGEMKDYYALAKHMGMKAIAVTNHGCVQGFPAAQAAHDADAKAIKKAGTNEKPLKIIYGAELYMFDSKPDYIFNPSSIPLREARYCVFDTETTGLSARYERMIEFGAVIVEKGRVLKRFDTFIKPDISLEHAGEAMAINNITADDLKNAPTIDEVLPQIIDLLADNVLVAHNATFDVGFLNAALERYHASHPDSNLPTRIENPIVDTLPLSHYLFPFAGKHNEQAMLKNLNLNVYDPNKAHRADYDCECLNDGWQEIILRLEKAHPGIRHEDLASLSIPKGDENDPALQSEDPDTKKKAEEKLAEDQSRYNNFCKHIRNYHCIVLVKNTQGLQDLYRIITEGETTYLERASLPKTPRDLINRYRANFLVGSACFNGEIFELAMTRNRDVLIDAVKWYDYIEI
ncbi:MAG TPA: hypothetical protein DEA63_05570, partial [Firmicutes bacterium]|nr:hypothetical protein [Bacillota bacterium]